MAYEIEDYGKKREDGIRANGVREPNFPPNYTAAQEDLVFGNDIRKDPADQDDISDPRNGFSLGIGLGTQGENADA